MNRLDRALGILLALRGGAAVPASELAQRFEVSARTIYRDIEALCAVGVPVYAEMGRRGGFRLAEGYFLPPIMFTVGEAASLLVGAAMLRRLRATPFASDLEHAAGKVIAALPEPSRSAILAAAGAIGFEAMPADLLHPEREQAPRATPAHESEVLSTFLQAIVDGRAVALRYHAPDQPAPSEALVAPHGLLWDRERWYLVGARAARPGGQRMWRADRVRAARQGDALAERRPAPDLGALLGRRWLEAPMRQWAQEAPVVLSLTAAQAAALRADWYYRHAQFSEQPGGRVAMLFGEDNPAIVFALLRWLGPGARLVEPQAWLPAWRADLQAMLADAGQGRE